MTTAALAGDSIRTFTDGHVTSAVRLWRLRREPRERSQGPLFATVVVKASFALAHDRAASPAPPEELLAEDRTFGGHPMRSVERAGELAPYLARCDVLCTGHAHAPGGRASTSVRLALYRERTPLLDKTLHLFGERKSGGAPQPFERMPLTYERAVGGAGLPANPVGTDLPNLVDPTDAQRPACFGPISRFWPARKKLLAGLDPALFAEVVWALPDAFPWDYFQAAPPDQQIPYLAGDEWLVLDGMHPQLSRLQTRLPGATASARLVTPGGDTAVALRADMLVVDADKGTCALVWRGRVELPAAERALASVAVVAGLDMPGRPVQWDALLTRAKTALGQAASASAAVAAVATAPGPGAGVGESTLGLSDAQQAAQSLRVIAPFDVAAPASAPPQSLTATPWGGPPSQVTPPAASPGESTLDLGAARSAAMAPAMVAGMAPAMVAGMAPAMVAGMAPAMVAGIAPAMAAGMAAPIAPPMMAPVAPSMAAPITSPASGPVTAPALAASARPAPAPVATPALAASAPPRRPKPASLEERLRAAGASAEDIAALAAALAPPPPRSLDE